VLYYLVGGRLTDALRSWWSSRAAPALDRGPRRAAPRRRARLLRTSLPASRGRGSFAGLILSSVSHALLHHPVAEVRATRGTAW